MKSSVNQAEIARISGLSRTAVSFALNPRLQSRLNPNTRDRILMTAEQLGYRPHRHAQLMRGKRSGLIGIIKTTHMMQTGVERSFFAAREIYLSHYGLLANEIQWSEKGIKHAVDAMLDARVEGVLIDGVSEESASTELRRLRDSKVPMVSLAGMPQASVPFVSADFRQGMFDLTNHLLALGFRKLMLVSSLRSADDNPPTFWSLLERRHGFLEALIRAGFDESEARVLYQPAQSGLFDGYALGRAAVHRLIESGERPEVLLCSNDEMAIGAIQASAEVGWRVPEEIAITGFDNTKAGRYACPALTSVAQPTEAVAKRAVELLLKQMRGETISAGEELVKMPCKVIVRQSCGAELRGSRTQ